MPRRKINVFGQPWEWHFGNPLLVWDPQGRMHEINLGTGIDRDIEKRNFALRPKQVVKLIATNFLHYSDRGGFPAGVLPDDFSISRREGFEWLAGPRGKWQIKVEPWSCALISPEGIDYQADVKSVMGQEWLDDMSARVADLYPRIVERLGGEASLTGEKRDLAWKMLREEIVLPKINYNAARSYIRERFGEVETVS